MWRSLAKVVAMVVGSLLVILGAHGLMVYFSRLELALQPQKAHDLFMLWALPSGITPIIDFMSVKGAQSWFIPGAFILVGILLWLWQRRWVWRSR